MPQEQIRLGLVGYGEVGSCLGLGLRRQGLQHVVAYDIASFEGTFSALIQSRANDAGVQLVRSPQELAQQADVIIAAVPGSECVAAAQAIAPYLDVHHVYVDIGSATPKIKRGVGDVLGRRGAKVGDGGIMGSPLVDGHRVPIAASGPAAREFAETMVPWGMRIDVVGDVLGAGSAIKIVRSVVMKGMEALFIECALGASRHGIEEQVWTTIARFMDERPFMETVKFLLRTDVIHAGRRAEEAAMSAEALEEVGVEPVMTRSTSRVLQRTAEMGLKEHFKGVVPDDYKAAVEAIDAALRVKA